ncbi:MAG: hypothetical protein ACSLFL_07180 [Alphaproteobacteria bacterium]
MNNNNANKAILIGLAVVAVILAAGFFLYMVDVDQTKEAQLPGVEMKVEEGQMPKFNVETGSMSVETGETTISVPEVEMKEETIEVPTGISITPPDKDGPAAAD